MNMKTLRQESFLRQAGFSLLELMLVCAILAIVVSSIMTGIQTTVQRSQAEQTKVDLTQEGREFIDEFQRDLHKAGYPNCRLVATVGVLNNGPADNTQPPAAGNPLRPVGSDSPPCTLYVIKAAVAGRIASVPSRVARA